MIPKHRILFSEAEVAARIEEMTRLLSRDLAAPAPVVIGLLTGSFVFVADLVRAMSRSGLEPLVDFMAASHYGPKIQSNGVVRVYKDLAIDIAGRPVLLVDDILDTGRTLKLVRDDLAARQPSWLRTCVLLDKPARRVVDVRADYVGFEVPDVWIVGYGLDAHNECRGLPYIATLEPAEET